MRRQIRFVGPAIAVIFALALGFGCSKAERQEMKDEHAVNKAANEAVRDANYRDDQWNDAVRYVNKGYDQMDDFDTKVFYDEPELAKMHLKKASKDFSDALSHFAKSEVGKGRQKAVDDLNSAVDALDKAYDELDKGDADAAESHYNTAVEYFDKAEGVLLE